MTKLKLEVVTLSKDGLCGGGKAHQGAPSASRHPASTYRYLPLVCLASFVVEI